MVQIPPSRLLATSLAVCFCSEMSVSYFGAVINVPEDVFENFLNSTMQARGFRLSERTLSMIWGFTVAVFSAGGIIGSALIRISAEKFGRKRTMMHLVPVLQLFGTLLSVAAYPAASIECLAIGRFFTGIGAGLLVGIVPMFLTECSPDEYRGGIAAMAGIFGCLGDLLVKILGLPSALGTKTLWPYLVGLGGLFPAVALMVSPLFPESPKYLFLTAHKDLDAIKSLQFYYGFQVRTRSILEEFRREEGFRKVNLFVILKTYHLRMALILSMVCIIAFVSAGMEVLSNYSTILLTFLGMGMAQAKVCSIVLSAMAFLGNLFAPLVIQRYPRRRVFIYGLIAVTVCNALLSVFDTIEESTHDKTIAYFSMVILVCHVLIFSIGPAIVAWIIPNELTLQSARSSTIATVSVGSWIGGMMASMLFLPIARSLGAWTYIILFVFPTALCCGYLWFKLPETKGRSIRDIMSPWLRVTGDPATDPEMVELVRVPLSSTMYQAL